MKKILIIFNSILALIVLLLTLGNLTAAEKSSTAPVSARKSARNAAKKSKAKAETKVPHALPELDEAMNKSIAADVFSNVRSPLANMRSGRTDMTLVGVFQSGNISAAIIKQNTRQRQYNPFLAQAMRMSGSGGAGYTRWSAMGNRGNANVPNKQYVRVGETLANGYTLADVNRSRAVLVRGNDKIELELQDPSKNRNARGGGAPRLNANQQFQQAQMFMQSQMIRTLRDIQRGSGNRSAAPANRGRR